MDFILFEEDVEYYSRFHLWEDHRRRMYTDKLEVHILELPKLSKFEYPKTELLEWAHFFAAESKEELEMLARENAYIKKAYDRLTTISADEQKRLEYEAREKAIRDYNWQMKSNWNAGVQQGKIDMISELLRDGLITPEEAAKRLRISRQEVEKLMK